MSAQLHFCVVMCFNEKHFRPLLQQWKYNKNKDDDRVMGELIQEDHDHAMKMIKLFHDVNDEKITAEQCICVYMYERNMRTQDRRERLYGNPFDPIYEYSYDELPHKDMEPDEGGEAIRRMIREVVEGHQFNIIIEHFEEGWELQF